MLFRDRLGVRLLDGIIVYDYVKILFPTKILITCLQRIVFTFNSYSKLMQYMVCWFATQAKDGMAV